MISTSRGILLELQRGNASGRLPEFCSPYTTSDWGFVRRGGRSPPEPECWLSPGGMV